MVVVILIADSSYISYRVGASLHVHVSTTCFIGERERANKACSRVGERERANLVYNGRCTYRNSNDNTRKIAPSVYAVQRQISKEDAREARLQQMKLTAARMLQNVE